MELLKNNHHPQMQFLADRTWDLHVKFDEKINQNGALNFCCSHCTNYNGGYDVEEREKMFAIKNSLKDLHTILISFQKLESCQNRQRNEALARLEESRVLLIERMNQCTEKERKLEVVQELTTFLGDGKNARFSIKGKMDEMKSANGISSFVFNTAKFAMEFVVALASIYSTVRLYNSRQKRDEVVSSTDSRMSARLKVSPFDSNIHLDVLCGRG